MYFYEDIKFRFDIDLIDESRIQMIFHNIENLLNIQFDENFNPYTVKNKNCYTFKEVSCENIYLETSKFFKFTFRNVIDTPLYKFLILKTDDRLIILAIINSLIFDYSSIGYLHDLFKSEDIDFQSGIMDYYNDVNNYISSSDFENDCRYWQNNYLGTDTYVKFHNIKSDNYKFKKIALDNNAINDFLNRYTISRSDFLIAVFSLYLSRIDNIKGCFLKTILLKNPGYIGPFDKNIFLKIKYDSNTSFIHYLNDISDDIKDSNCHAQVDVEDYVNEYTYYYSVFDFSNLDESVKVFNHEGALTLNIYRNSLELGYNSDLLSDEYIDSMLANINSLIDNLIDSPNQQCGNVDILSDGEKDLILKFSKGGNVSFDENKTLALAFRENALKNPEVIAIDDGINQISYGELEKSTNNIANILISKYAIELGDRIGLMLPRNYHFPECVLALNKIGAAFMPIDSQYPMKRIERMLDISEAKYIITTRQYPNLPEFNVGLIFIEDLVASYDGALECKGNGDNLFSIFFTSGTTGLPKGVMFSNKQIANETAVLKNIYHSHPGDLCGCYVSFSFALSSRMYFALYNGETCRIFNEKEQKDTMSFIKALNQQTFNDLFLPSSLSVLFNENEANINVKYLMFAGSKLNKMPHANTHTKLFNVYGTSETLLTIAYLLDDDSNDMPIGKPLDNYNVHILDENKMPVPIGVAGDLYISGKYISPGYFKNLELTDEFFSDSSEFGFESDSRIYYTGDVCFYNFDGNIEVVGRRDDQLSVRGFRIESNEIINIMNEFDFISDICLDIYEDNLIAYYTTNHDCDIQLLENALKNELPDYMIPSFFIKLDNIPLNKNGKINKNALPKIDLAKMQEEYVAPITKNEKIIVKAFESVFDNKNIGVYDDFVKLGGNSIMAMQMLPMLSQYNIDINARVILNNRTPYNIAKSIDEDGKNYGFKLVKKGNIDQNLFLIPPIGGISFVFANLIENLDFCGNVYIIDDFRYDMPLEEIKKTEDSKLTLDYYYNSIKNLFQDDDIILGYSLGCIYTTLLADKLEKDNKKIGNCILVDGFLEYVIDTTPSVDELTHFIKDAAKGHNIDDLKETYSDEFIEKFIEIGAINFRMNFPIPQVNSKITFLATFEHLIDDVKKYFSNYEFIIIDSTHKDIIDKDCRKIIEYIK